MPNEEEQIANEMLNSEKVTILSCYDKYKIFELFMNKIDPNLKVLFKYCPPQNNIHENAIFSYEEIEADIIVAPYYLKFNPSKRNIFIYDQKCCNICKNINPVLYPCCYNLICKNCIVGFCCPLCNSNIIVGERNIDVNFSIMNENLVISFVNNNCWKYISCVQNQGSDFLHQLDDSDYLSISIDELIKNQNKYFCLRQAITSKISFSPIMMGISKQCIDITTMFVFNIEDLDNIHFLYELKPS